MQTVNQLKNDMFQEASEFFLDFEVAKRDSKSIGRIIGDIIDLNLFEQHHPAFRYSELQEVGHGNYAKEIFLK